MNSLIAIILAAGKGARIGQPKWQLLYRGKTFLDIIIATLHQAALHNIICVMRPEFYSTSCMAKVVPNPCPDQGMISSIYYGIQSAPDAFGYLIFPVDYPQIQAETLIALQEAFVTNPEMAVQPIYQGQVGHPLIIPRIAAKLIPSTDYAGGLKQLLTDEKIAIKYVSVNDPGVLNNINKKTDLDKLS